MLVLTRKPKQQIFIGDNIVINIAEVQGDNVRYNDVYVNRVRLQPGIEWRLNRRQTLDFYLLGDYTYDKSYDAKKNGNLKVVEDASGVPVYDAYGDPVYAIFYEKAWHFSLGVSYSYAF